MFKAGRDFSILRLLTARRYFFAKVLIAAFVICLTSVPVYELRKSSRSQEAEEQSAGTPLDLARMIADSTLKYGQSCTARLVCELPLPRQRSIRAYWTYDPPVAFSNDSRSIAIGDYAGRVKLFAVESGKEVATSPELQAYSPTASNEDSNHDFGSLNFSPDGKLLFVTGGGNYILDASTLTLRHKFAGVICNSLNEDRPYIRPDGKSFVASLYLDNTPKRDDDIALWDSGTLSKTATLVAAKEAFLPIWALSPDGKTLVFSKLNPKWQCQELCCLDVASQAVRWVTSDICEFRLSHDDFFNQNGRNPNFVGSACILRFSENGANLVVGFQHYNQEHGPAKTRMRFLRVINVQTGEVSGRVCHLGVIDHVRVLEKYGALVSRKSGNEMRVTPLAKLPLDSPNTRIISEGRDRYLALSPDGLLFAVENKAEAFDLCFTANNAPIPIGFGRRSPAAQPRTFSPDGKYLATFSVDKVRVWELDWHK